MWMLWIVGALAAAVAGSAKGRSAVGWFFYGLLLWPVAIIHALCLPPPKSAAPNQERRIACPACSELILPDALICPHCRSPHAAGEQFRERSRQEQEAAAARAVDDAAAWRVAKKRGWILAAVLVACFGAALLFANRR